MALTVEKWKSVTFCPAYEVSNFGRVRRVSMGASNCYKSRSLPYLLNPWKHKSGYLLIDLAGYGQIRVHRLVGLIFLNKPYWASQINHLDGDKTNNHVQNLSWTNNSGNQVHAHWLHPLKYPHKFIPEQIKEIRNLVAPLKTIANKFGISVNTTLQIRKRRYYAWVS